MDVSIIIVSYNTRQMTLECLRSVYEQTRGITFEVTVVDNDSKDGSAEAIAEAYPQVRLLAKKENLGFGVANNLAATYCTGEYLLLLNPDTVVLDSAVQRLLRFARANPEAGVYGGRTLYADGSLNPASCWAAPTLWSVACAGMGLSFLFWDSKWFNSESMPEWRRDTVREVDIVTGCWLLIRRELWERLGGFDPGFFMYGEDADLCLRARQAGARCLICPDATIVHYRGASESVRADKMVRLFKARSQFFARHWRRGTVWWGVRTIDIWAASRLMGFGTVQLVDGSRREAYTTWREIWSRRSEWREVPELKSPVGVLPGRGVAGVTGHTAVLPAKMINLTFHGIGETVRPLSAEEEHVWISRELYEGVLDLVKDRRDVRITFDDGNASDYEIALPALVKRGLKAHFFVVARRMDEPGSLSRSQIREMQAAGMTIGVHGMHHQPWRPLKGAALEEEIVESRRLIEAVVAEKADEAACPFGSYGRQTLLALRRAGYRHVYTSDRATVRRSAWLQPRFTVTKSDTLASLERVLKEGVKPEELVQRAKVLLKRWR